MGSDMWVSGTREEARGKSCDEGRWERTQEKARRSREPTTKIVFGWAVRLVTFFPSAGDTTAQL